MTKDEQYASEVIADCAKEINIRIFTAADNAGLDRLSFMLNVAAVLASSALVAQPEEQLQAASRYIQNALGLVHCLRNAENAPAADNRFTASEALQ